MQSQIDMQVTPRRYDTIPYGSIISLSNATNRIPFSRNIWSATLNFCENFPFEFKIYFFIKLAIKYLLRMIAKKAPSMHPTNIIGVATANPIQKELQTLQQAKATTKCIYIIGNKNITKKIQMATMIAIASYGLFLIYLIMS